MLARCKSQLGLLFRRDSPGVSTGHTPARLYCLLPDLAADWSTADAADQ